MENLNVDTKHKEYAKFEPEWRQIKDCVAGERAVKAKGQLYLPNPAHNPQKTDPDGRRYRAYRHRAAFLNATGRTLQALLGVAFSKAEQVALTGDLALLEDDTDGKGTPIAQVLRGAASDSLTEGRFGFLVDYTRELMIDESGAYIPQTVEQAALNRVVIRRYAGDQIINWREAGDTTTLVVLKEIDESDSTNTDDFGANEVTVWTELRLIDGKAFMRRWYQNLNMQEAQMSVPRGMSKTGLVPIVGKSGVQLDTLPWAWGGAEDNNASVDEAPLADISALNIKHFCAEADLAEIAHIVGTPTLIVTGLTQAWVDKNMKDGLSLGATRGLPLPEKGSASLLQAEDRNLSIALCERREKQMAMIGASIIERGSAPKTATEAQFDAQTDNSILSLCIGNVEASFNKALRIASEFVSGEGTVTLNKRYSDAIVDSNTLTAMMSGVANGTVRLIDLIIWMQGAGLIDDQQIPEEVETDLRDALPLPGASLLGAQNTPVVDENANV